VVRAPKEGQPTRVDSSDAGHDANLGILVKKPGTLLDV
jgi:hypothetical protein